VLSLSGPAAAGDRSPAGAVVDTAQVNLVNVEVFVTDRSGRPVLGLRRDDFQLFEDGKPVAISNFYAAAPPGAAPAEASDAEEAALLPAATASAPPLEQRLSLVLFVDNTGITPAQRNIALQRGAALLDAVFRLPRVEVMVVTHGPFTRIRQPFTSEAGAIRAVLRTIEREPTDMVGVNSEQMLLERVMSRVGLTGRFETRGAFSRGIDAADALSTLQLIRGAAQEAHERTRAAVASIQDFVTSLAGLPGRKAVCYVGNGIQLRPGEDLLQQWQRRFEGTVDTPGFSPATEANSLSVAPEFRALVSHANADRVTFYALDAAGESRSAAQSPEEPDPQPDPGIGQVEEIGRHYSLQYLAYATGGTTVVSTPQASSALARITEDFSAFYSLAYVAPHLGDGKDHSITVKTARDGVEVRYRRRYLDKTADDRMTERSLAALVYDSGSNGLDVGIVVGKEAKQRRGVFIVPVLVTVPLDKLALLPHGDAREGGVSIWLSSKDDEDRITPPVKNVFAIHISNADMAAAQGKNAGYSFRLLLRRGVQKVAVSVRDDVTLTESTVTAQFSVGRGASRPPAAIVGMNM